MPKIRKKTSKRTTTHMREKIKKKVTEAHRKQKKAAKKDVTWKSRVKKDPGIPSLFPYKEEVLQEAMQAKARKEEEKALKKQESKVTVASLANTAAEQDAVEPDTDSEEEDSADPEASTSNLKAHARSLRSVISTADILIQVLDARDPLGTRTVSLEKEILTHNASHSSKKLVLVLNKIDLAPKENVQAWLTYLRRSFPTLAFRSSTQSQRNNLSSRSQNSTGAAATSANSLLTLLKSYARGTSKSLTVGVVGLPNVGKSSLINTLKRSKACSVAPTPGWTKNVQTVVLDGGLKILDCPGVVLDEPTGNVTGDEVAQKVLRSAVEVDKLVDPLTPVELILSKCKHEHLMMLYNIPSFSTTQEFLIHVARARGRLRKGGLPDITGSAKSVIRDWTAGRIPYYTVPPSLPTAAPLSNDTPMDTPVETSDAIVGSFAPEFDLDALFKSADEEALDGLKGVKESKGVAMKKGGLSVPEGEVKLLGEDQDHSMEAQAPTAAPKSKKRRHVETEPIEQETVSVAPPSKKKAVTFASSQQTRLFTDGEAESMGQNKAIAKAAKKDKKRKLKAASGAMDTTEAVAEDPVDALTRGLEARTKSLTFQDEGKATGGDDDAYDFASFFGREKGLELDQDA